MGVGGSGYGLHSFGGHARGRHVLPATTASRTLSRPVPPHECVHEADVVAAHGELAVVEQMVTPAALAPAQVPGVRAAARSATGGVSPAGLQVSPAPPGRQLSHSEGSAEATGR